MGVLLDKTNLTILLLLVISLFGLDIFAEEQVGDIAGAIITIATAVIAIVKNQTAIDKAAEVEAIKADIKAERSAWAQK